MTKLKIALQIVICAIVTIVIMVKIISFTLKTDGGGDDDSVADDSLIYGFKSLINEMKLEDSSRLRMLTIMGITFVSRSIMELKGEKSGLFSIHKNGIQSKYGDYPFIQTFIPNRELYIYDNVYGIPNGTNSTSFTDYLYRKNKFCGLIDSLCDSKSLNDSIFNSAKNNSYFTKYIWYDPFTNEAVIRNAIAVSYGNNKSISSSYTEYSPTTDEIFNLLSEYPSGLIKKTSGKGNVQIKTSYLDLLKSTNFNTKNVFRTIDISGDNALISYGYIFMVLEAIQQVGIKNAIDEFNKPETLSSTIDTKSGRYVFILAFNKLTEKYTVMLHNSNVYRDMEVKEQEELILKQVICGNDDDDSISCDLTQNELYKTFKRLRQGSGALKMFDLDDNIIDYIYMDFSLNKLVNKKSVFIRYTDPSEIYIDYVIGSGWTESILHAEK